VQRRHPARLCVCGGGHLRARLCMCMCVRLRLEKQADESSFSMSACRAADRVVMLCVCSAARVSQRVMVTVVAVPTHESTWGGSDQLVLLLGVRTPWCTPVRWVCRHIGRVACAQASCAGPTRVLCCQGGTALPAGASAGLREQREGRCWAWGFLMRSQRLGWQWLA
jgi:hypothetical protein